MLTAIELIDYAEGDEKVTIRFRGTIVGSGAAITTEISNVAVADVPTEISDELVAHALDWGIVDDIV